MEFFFRVSISLGIILLPIINANAIVIRHDVNDQKYIDLGQQYSSSVAYAGGCAATVLSKYWLLTAAHCIAGREHNFFTAEHLGKDYRIEKMLLHPKFDKKQKELFDIALIQLKEPISNGTPAKLYTSSDELGRQVVFVGRGAFGNGEKGLIKSDSIERGATNKVVSVSNQTIGFRFDEPENATEFEGISSRGDSGGPAFFEVDSKRYVVGVSSFQERKGLKEGTYGVYEYYPRVSLYVDWLNSAMRKAKTPLLPRHPVIEAVKNDDPVQFKIQLSKTQKLNKKVEILSEAIYQSVMYDRVAMAQELLKSGMDVKNVKINKMSIFDFALIKGRNNYFDMVLTNTIGQHDVHEPTSTVLPLVIATFNSDAKLMERVQFIVNQGVDINAKTADGDTALIATGWNTDNLELLKFLVERGADVNLANNDGNTPLMDAASLGKVEILRYLLVAGANTTLKNKNGKTALDLARGKNNEEIIGLLMAY